MHKHQKVRRHYAENFAETHEPQAEIPVLTEVREDLLLGHPQNVSKNERINEAEVIPFPRTAGEEGIGLFG